MKGAPLGVARLKTKGLLCEPYFCWRMGYTRGRQYLHRHCRRAAFLPAKDTCCGRVKLLSFKAARRRMSFDAEGLKVPVVLLYWNLNMHILWGTSSYVRVLLGVGARFLPNCSEASLNRRMEVSRVPASWTWHNHSVAQSATYSRQL